MSRNPVIDKDGIKRWYNEDGELHRIDGHAIELVNGDKYWYLNGDRHRIDGPAMEYADGSKEWYLDGEYHRIDGPAIEWKDGTKYWYLNGNELSEDLYKTITQGDIKDLPLYLGLGFDGYISERLVGESL